MKEDNNLQIIPSSRKEKILLLQKPPKEKSNKAAVGNPIKRKKSIKVIEPQKFTSTQPDEPKTILIDTPKVKDSSGIISKTTKKQKEKPRDAVNEYFLPFLNNNTDDDDDEFIPNTIEDEEPFNILPMDLEKEYRELKEEIEPKYNINDYHDFVRSTFSEKEAKGDDDKYDLDFIPYEDIFGDHDNEDEVENSPSNEVIPQQEINELISTANDSNSIKSQSSYPTLENLHLSLVVDQKYHGRVFCEKQMEQLQRQIQLYVQLLIQNLLGTCKQDTKELLKISKELISHLKTLHLQCIYSHHAIQYNRKIFKSKTRITRNMIRSMYPIESNNIEMMKQVEKENKKLNKKQRAKSIINLWVPRKIMSSTLRLVRLTKFPNGCSKDEIFQLLSPYCIMKYWDINFMLPTTYDNSKYKFLMSECNLLEYCFKEYGCKNKEDISFITTHFMPHCDPSDVEKLMKFKINNMREIDKGLCRAFMNSRYKDYYLDSETIKRIIKLRSEQTSYWKTIASHLDNFYPAPFLKLFYTLEVNKQNFIQKIQPSCHYRETSNFSDRFDTIKQQAKFDVFDLDPDKVDSKNTIAPENIDRLIIKTYQQCKKSKEKTKLVMQSLVDQGKLPKTIQWEERLEHLLSLMKMMS